MFPDRIYNVNIVNETRLSTPVELKQRIPLTDKAEQTVYENRCALQRIMTGEETRLCLVVGPCSIHDTRSALEYAGRLRQLSDEVADTFLVVMRCYFEKPRTTTGWKGLINDPFLDDSYHIEDGLFIARKLLCEIAEIGVPAATEALDPIIPQYLHDLITWTSIGARTTESQRHREMASGLSTPVGFKNSTDGNVQVAINALESISRSHHFISIDRNGQCALFQTRGNAYGHLVLRGGAQTNYDAVSIALCERALRDVGLPERLMVDCSHGNSRKDPTLQPLVFDDCVQQIEQNNRSIFGLMVESHLKAGSQKLVADPKRLEYGKSITDGCIDWETTERLIRAARQRLRPVLQRRAAA